MPKGGEPGRGEGGFGGFARTAGAFWELEVI